MSKELETAQNRTKQAIAGQVADELGSLKSSLTKSAQSLNDLRGRLAQSWEGAAADAFLKKMEGVSASLSELGSRARTLSSAVKSAAAQAYPG
jgi:uncharacterized protein YukE